MEGDPRVAVEAVGFGQPAALLLPGRADAGGVGARRALERVEREVAPALLLPAEVAPCERARRVRVDVREFAAR